MSVSLLGGLPPSRRRPALVRTLVGAASVLAVCAVGLLAAAFWMFFMSPQNSVAVGTPVVIDIAAGSSNAQIARVLTEAGIVRNANMFRLRTRFTRADAGLKPGVYHLTTGMLYESVVSALKRGPDAVLVTVTIPEGFVIEQIAARVQSAAGVSRLDFLRLARGGAKQFVARHPLLEGAYKGSLEGYLFPKTYEIRRGESAAQVIEMMLTQFDTEAAGVDFAPARQRGLSPRQVVVVASMIERESKLSAERPLTSSVIYNRLHIGMLLKIDATIEYVLRDKRFRLTNRDLRTPSPYNTYSHKGLPPGPISNPGLASIKAAAAPADTRFLYYVLTGKDGSHTFATSLADFLVAKARSKRVFGK